MTKAEFLELRAGEQRWILLRCLLMMFMKYMAYTLTDGNMHDATAVAESAADSFEEVMDATAKEEPW